MNEHETVRTKDKFRNEMENATPIFYVSCYLVQFSLLCHPTLNTIPINRTPYIPEKYCGLQDQCIIRS
jgi:hypothetical protein